MINNNQYMELGQGYYCAWQPHDSSVTGEFPAKKPVTRSIDVSLICACMNDWVNNGEAGDLRRRRAHYDVTVMEDPR